MINFAANLNKMIDAGLGGPLDPPRTEVAVGHRVIYKEASGAVASFETNVIAPLRNLRVTMEPVQAGSGDPSPDNVRPITGRDVVTVTRTGVNLFDKSAAIFGILNASGDIISTTQVVKKVSDFIPVVPGGKYYAQNVVPGSDGRTGFWYNASKTGLSMATLANNSATSGIFTAPSDAAYIRISAYAASVDTTMLEVGELKSDYEPYDGQSATIQLGQTVYGGTVDVTTGVLTVDRWYLTLNNARTVSYHTGTVPSMWLTFATDKVADASSGSNVMYSSYTRYGIAQGDMYARLYGTEVDVYDPRFTDEATARTLLADFMAVYKLKNPITIQLTPEQMTTLHGQNNVWSDADSVTLEYPYYEETEGY